MLQQIKNTIRHTVVLALLVGSFVAPPIVSSSIASAGTTENTPQAANSVDDARTTGNNKCKARASQLDSSNCGIIKLIVIVTNVLSGIAATVIIMMIVIGGIQYSAAGANPQKVAAAKSKIINALIALMLFLFSFAFLQWLIPGGLFN